MSHTTLFSHAVPSVSSDVVSHVPVSPQSGTSEKPDKLDRSTAKSQNLKSTDLSPASENQYAESLFDTVGHVMNSINTWISNNNNNNSSSNNDNLKQIVRPNQSRNMLEKMTVNKKKRQTVDTHFAPLALDEPIHRRISLSGTIDTSTMSNKKKHHQQQQHQQQPQQQLKQQQQQQQQSQQQPQQSSRKRKIEDEASSIVAAADRINEINDTNSASCDIAPKQKSVSPVGETFDGSSAGEQVVHPATKKSKKTANGIKRKWSTPISDSAAATDNAPPCLVDRPLTPVPPPATDDACSLPARKKRKRSSRSRVPQNVNKGDAESRLDETRNAEESSNTELLPPSSLSFVSSSSKNRSNSSKKSETKIIMDAKAIESKGEGKCESKDPAASVVSSVSSSLAQVTTATPSLCPVKKRLVKFQRCNETKVAQFEIFDNRPPKKRPPVPLLKLGIRALQPRALLPGESCLISGNLFCDPAAMHNVELTVYGEEINVHVSAAGSLVDRETGGLSVYLVNVSPSFYQINVGDVIGYVQFRSVDGTLKLCAQ